MHKRITMRHMDHAPDVENYAHDALEKILNALEGEKTPVYVDLILEPGRPHAHHAAELLIKTPSFSVVFKQEGPHIFQLIDRVCDLAYRKIHEEKKKKINDRRSGDSFKGV